MELFLQIQKATIAARARTGDNSISTRVSEGKMQIVTVTFKAGGKSTVNPASDWMSASEIIAALGKI